MAEVVEDLGVVGADPITLVRRKGLPDCRQPLFLCLVIPNGESHLHLNMTFDKMTAGARYAAVQA